MGIVSEAGQLVVSYEYDAWGNVLEISGSMAETLGELNPLRYRGYVYDHETGLYYLQSRYYNPQWGRFLNADTLVSTGQGELSSNMFAYCRNNPVHRKDASGQADYDCVDDSPLDEEDILDIGRGGGGGGWNSLMGAVDSVSFGMNLAMGGRDGMSLVPSSPTMVSDNFIKRNNIDAHGFKQHAGHVDSRKLSKYNIYKDTSDGNRLWVGTNNSKNRDWRWTDYTLEDLLLFWRK